MTCLDKLACDWAPGQVQSSLPTKDIGAWLPWSLLPGWCGEILGEAACTQTHCPPAPEEDRRWGGGALDQPPTAELPSPDCCSSGSRVTTIDHVFTGKAARLSEHEDKAGWRGDMPGNSSWKNQLQRLKPGVEAQGICSASKHLPQDTYPIS